MFNSTRFYIRDGALIGDFRDAVQPLVWRMELSRVHAVGFRVVQDGAHWNLGVESSKSEFTPIASFNSESGANRALKRLGFALHSQGLLRRSFSVLLWILFIVMVLYVISWFIPMGGGQVEAQIPPTLGQPLPADQALRVPVK